MRNEKVYGQCEQITNLLNALKGKLPELPGFRSLSLYGSLAEGRADRYSDIDVMVTTDNLPDAKEQLLGVLERIGSIEFSWQINLFPDEWNNTILFREESYYHKLDLGLVDISAEQRIIPSEQTVVLCDQHRPPGQVASKSTAYAPQHGSIGHFLLGHLIGCTRYLKARRRGQTMTCYRFAAAAVDWNLALAYARLTGKHCFRSKLSTENYLELDRRISADQRATLMSDIDFSTGLAMDHTLRTSMKRMLEDGAYLAVMEDEILPPDVFNGISTFLDEELSHT